MIKVPATLIDFVLVAIVILAVAWLILGPERSEEHTSELQSQ